MVDPSISDSQQAQFVARLKALLPKDVLHVGQTNAQIVRCWGDDQDNLLMVITGERAQHFLERHPEVQDALYLLPALLLDPDEVHRNRAAENVAVFYRSIEAGQYLRAAVAMQSAACEHAHSMLSVRFCRDDEVKRGDGRCVWRR